MTRRPTKVFKSKISPSISISIWHNDNGGISITLSKGVKDKNGNWENARINCWPADALAIAMELRKVLKYIDDAPDESSFAPQKVSPAAEEPAAQQSFSSDDDIPF